MTYTSFEDTPVWQEAARLYELTEDLLENRAWRITSGFRDQLDRAALSVSNNIAEGFERGTTNELLYFLYVARGSAGETRSMLRVRLRRVSDPKLKSQISELIACAVSCSRQLRGWADSLQNSDIPGQRHLNERTRRDYDRQKRSAEFQKHLLRLLPPGHPLRKDAEKKGIKL
jgi:four helix bundle protein